MTVAAANKTETGLILRTDRDGIARLTLNRPDARNALSTDLMTDLAAALDAISADRSVRVVVLAGAGPAFCAGHDLKELRAIPGGSARMEALFRQCSRLMLAIRSLPQPVIACVHGMATAAGCQLVASCDLAVASPVAKFATPGVNIGLFCSTPMVALSRAVGRKRAMEMLLTGAAIDAETAAAAGLINRVVPAEDLEGAVMDLAGKIAGKSAATIKIGKEAFYRQAEMGLDDAYDYAAAVMAENMKLRDAAEGIAAFVGKRPPNWTDR